MPDIIHLLPDSVANQIAAGEVIQRPASVIKELVENSLDAGANHIQVIVENAGKTLIQVVDNGKGMSTTDARLAFERHATSKIRQATDLFSLQTMGFRGEALPSIASVAQVELKTRTENNEIGTYINIEGSKLISQSATSCPIGANFSVRNLFFNIPARRKFLKSNSTELTNIVNELERIALPHPEIAFSLQNDGKMMLNLPPGNFRQRIANLFGSKINSQILPIDTNTTLVQIKGFVGTPAASNHKKTHQYLFTNGRFMRHPYFVKAIQTAYERLIPDNNQVPFFICLTVDPSRIDVNIHPSKTEIKFEDDSAVFQILLSAVREALGKYGAVPTIDFDVENSPNIPFLDKDRADIVLPQIHIDPSFNPFSSTKGQENTKKQDFTTPTYPSSNSSLQQKRNPTNWQETYAKLLQTQKDEYITYQRNNQSIANAEQENFYRNIEEQDIDKENNIWQINSEQNFLQFQGRYIVMPLSSRLAVIDQHKAHIRVLYEQFMQQLQKHNGLSQHLLFPEMFTVPISKSIIFEQITPQLQDIGFDISPLGAGSYSILGIPMGIEGLDPVQLLHSILSDAITGQANASETVNSIIALSLARRVAMPIGQILSNDEMRQLVGQLFTCSIPNYTPDGANILVLINLETLF